MSLKFALISNSIKLISFLVNNLNVANEALQEAIHVGDVTKQIQLNNAIKFNGGGHLNHTIFWQVSIFNIFLVEIEIL